MRETRPTGAVPSVAAGRIATAPSLARGADASPDVLSLFGYFKACATGGYARFRGRARRKEYWGFVLFFYLGSMLFGAVGGVLDGVMGNIGDEEPIFLIALPVLFGLAMIVPSIALTVRRIHDIGLSGWFFLLALIPTVGGLIILVFMLVPSQKHANRWGEVPPGVL
jgi:uncharacterized membrane protein YhaH (DUF805 family)